VTTELEHADATPRQAGHVPSDSDAAVGRPLGAQLLGWTFAQMLRTMHATWRKDVGDMALLDELIAARQPHIVSFWHRKYVALFPMLRRRHACVVTTASPHGHVVASICRHFGNSVIQVPGSGHGPQALDMIGHAIAHASEAGIAVDGPVGPDHKVKRGAIQLASELGHLIVPMSVASRHKHVLHHRWDRLEIPMIFSRVCVAVGEPMRIPPGLSWEEVQRWRSRLQDLLEAIDSEAEDRVRRR
jgi:lysophospholipid acyltransferase (LPLAT)-like uncharacterized protein